VREHLALFVLLVVVLATLVMRRLSCWRPAEEHRIRKHIAGPLPIMAPTRHVSGHPHRCLGTSFTFTFTFTFTFGSGSARASPGR